MRKMIFALTAAMLMLAGCAQENTLVTEVAATEAETEPVTETMPDIPETSDDGGELFDFVLTLPAGYTGKVSQDYLDNVAAENGYLSITQNADGSLTYIMTQSQHEKMMDGIVRSVENSINIILDDNTYPNFTDITANDDYTLFTVITEGESISYEEQYSVKLLYRCGEMYNDYNGTPVDNIHVDFINDESGEVIAYADSGNQ